MNYFTISVIIIRNNSFLLLLFKLLYMNYQQHVLPNGIKLIHIQAVSPVAHCGFFINAGSRDETEIEHGVAHFIEHLFFKGTHKRKSFHIISRLEDVGGELNAYTTKEDTCIHASFLKDYYPRTIELFSDIIFHSTFPEKALVSERDVIIDEINSYRDNPSEFIFDEWDEHFFRKHPLGLNILGNIRQLKKIRRENLVNFMSRTYNTNEMVLASVGDISFSKLVLLFERNFKDIPQNTRNTVRLPFNNYNPFALSKRKSTFQVHSMIGSMGFDMKDPRRMGLHLLSNIIGGNGMSSRLNLALRERNGYCYNIESSFTSYTDTGLFTIYFSTEKEYYKKCLDVIDKELNIIRNKPFGSYQLKKAKQQMIGQLAISYESNENKMLSIGKSLLVYDRVDSLPEIYEKIEAITATELMDIANEVLDKDKLSLLTYM